MESNKTKYFLVGCATILVAIIIALIFLAILIGAITLAYAERGDAWAITTIIAGLFILVVICGLLWKW